MAYFFKKMPDKSLFTLIKLKKVEYFGLAVKIYLLLGGVV